MNVGQVIIKVNKEYFRPAEVNNLVVIKKSKKIGLETKIGIDKLINIMLEENLKY